MGDPILEGKEELVMKRTIALHVGSSRVCHNHFHSRNHKIPAGHVNVRPYVSQPDSSSMQTRPRSPQIAPYRILPSIAKLSWIQLVMWSLHQGKQHKLWRARIVNTFQLHSFRTRFQPDRQLRRLWQRFLAGSLCRQFRPFSPNTTRDHRTDIFRG